MPTVLILNGKEKKKQYNTQALSKPRLLNYDAEWTIIVAQHGKLRIEWMIIKWCWSSNDLNRSVISQLHCLLLVYQQFRSRYWHPPGQFCVYWWFFKCPWRPWTMTVSLDEHKQRKMEKIMKQYTMILIAYRRWKFKSQNWRYGHHFGLNTNFCEFFSCFQELSQFSGYFRSLFRGINYFRSFRGRWLLWNINKVQW